jgi:hypothetical protein
MGQVDVHIAFLGNCQTAGIVAALKALRPDAKVKGFHVGPHFAERAELMANLDGFDVVIAHIRPDEDDELFNREKLLSRYRRVVLMHSIAFTGFHPDIARVSYRGALLEGPMDVYHSAIIAAAYWLGLDPHRVPRLFNALTYSKLGYFDHFTAAKEEFLARHLAVGFDLRAHFDHWLREGPFMHVINHPRIDVLSTMATLAAEQAGLVEERTPPPADLEDILAYYASWPVYPELGRRIGIAGSLQFKCSGAGASPAPEALVPLERLVERFYETYSALPDLTFDSLGVEAARDALVELLSPSLT